MHADGSGIVGWFDALRLCRRGHLVGQIASRGSNGSQIDIHPKALPRFETCFRAGHLAGGRAHGGTGAERRGICEDSLETEAAGNGIGWSGLRGRSGRGRADLEMYPGAECCPIFYFAGLGGHHRRPNSHPSVCMRRFSRCGMAAAFF